MSSFLDALPSRLRGLEESITDDLTLMVQNHAREAGWPRDCWSALRATYQDTPDESGFRGYKITMWRADGDYKRVLAPEYGFDGFEPEPAVRRMATRLKSTAEFLIDQRLRGAS